MPTAKVRGVELNYLQAGRGPDVVLIHGVAGNMAMWYLCGLVTRLAKQFRVTCYDLRGHGYSGSSPDGYTSRDMAEDLLGLMQATGVDSAVLLGHSFGANIATHTAVLAPQRVSGVVISDANFPGLTHLQKNPGEWPGWERYRKRAAEYGVEISSDWLDLELMFKQIASFTPEMREKFAEIAGEATVDRMMQAAATTCGRDIAEVAGLTEQRILAVEPPVVCVYGEQSPFLPTCNYLAERMPDCRVELVPEAEHFAFEENPDAFVEIAVRSLCLLSGVEFAEPSNAKPQFRRAETLMTRDRHA